ncbi:MAG: aldolase/citrate lyase family protein [Acidobacteria bacterium]|nr:aldolase/citrate lyase family protein [Acidobacteriota bacterium]
MKPPLKQRLLSGEICTGTFLLFLSGGDVVQFLAGLGLDYLILDMEHGSLDLGRARETILAARACGVAPLVRVAEAQYGLITRALDAGAEGIVLPRVETPQQCRDLVRCARYAPDGERGVTTFAGHNDFAPVADVPGFLAERNRNILLMVQIETRTGLNHRSEILSEAGIDGCLVGTGDLAFSLGCPGQTNHPDVIAGAESVFATCRDNGQLYTLPIRTPDDTARWQAAGMTMMTLSTDGGLLAAGARQFLSSVNRHRAPSAETVKGS